MGIVLVIVPAIVKRADCQVTEADRATRHTEQYRTKPVIQNQLDIVYDVSPGEQLDDLMGPLLLQRPIHVPPSLCLLLATTLSLHTAQNVANVSHSTETFFKHLKNVNCVA